MMIGRRHLKENDCPYFHGDTFMVQGAFLVVSDTLGVEWGFPDWVTNTIKGRIENKVDLCLCF